ncbi:hypothetical protein UlMin_039794 [Ulmus minor]
MEQWKADDFSAASPPSSSHPLSVPATNRSHNSHSDSRQRTDATVDPTAARKVQKADREKLRRDRLNEHFLELGNTLEPDRPKNDKATILTDTIQVLKDLTAEVNRLKADHSTLSEESRELTQEKNELREEKASLKSDIENLNIQYQQRMRVMFPWTTIDPSVMMAPPYSYPVPVAVPPGSIPFHPSSQPFPFYGGQNPGAIPNPCSTFVPYPPPTNPPVEQPASQHVPTSHSHVSSKQDSKSKSSDHNNGGRCDDSTDVATDLELKMPGSSAQQDLTSGGRKGKQLQRKEKTTTDGSSSSRYSSQVLQDSSSNSVGDIPKSIK